MECEAAHTGAGKSPTSIPLEEEAAREPTAVTLEQVIKALIDLLQDEPDKALKAAIRHIADKVVAAWNQRRRDGVPLRAAPKAKGRVKKAREAEVNEQLEAGLSRALGLR